MDEGIDEGNCERGGSQDTHRLLSVYCPFMRVPITGTCGADNWFVPIIGNLRYVEHDLHRNAWKIGMVPQKYLTFLGT